MDIPIEKYKELIDKKYSHRQIAKELNISNSLAYKDLKKFNLKTVHIANKPIPTYKSGYKWCSGCKASLRLNNFGLVTNKEYHLSQCKKCKSDKKNIRRNNSKKAAVEYKGGKCCICGFCKYIGSLDFHHVDQSTKDFSFSDRRISDIEKIKPELDKCVLVCRNCHGMIHAGIIPNPPLRTIWNEIQEDYNI